ncbi:vWA domain-containing protein [Wenxinia marina]|uniref:VWFA domain-containing protein n=1 Tax=Wenxinia marina DSM 24838 TaxID=1123501 RepID=A0A0D0Q4N3_9RHOB|nr:vWA domain-containing protein [Wenxinia marina]KIQ69494.1 Uncharacterized protein Wenmar_01856 [Wenxinia marina DSM 24838]GGL58778.1 hypothetical protein GCM10011392_11610 [Wenxinia marina]
MPDRLWPFAAQRPVTEVLEWSTDVLVTEAAEQRIALRTAPRSTLTFPHLIDAIGLAGAAELGRAASLDDWTLPLWHLARSATAPIDPADPVILVDTTDGAFGGAGQAVVAADGVAAHLVEVAAVLPDRLELATRAGVSLVHAVVAPVGTAFFARPLEIDRGRQGLGTVRASFTLRSLVPAAWIGRTAIYIAMDTSGSMSGSRMAAQKAALARLVHWISEEAFPTNDIIVVTWNASVTGSLLRRNADAAAYAEVTTWIEALSDATSGGTDFGAAVSEAPDFFAGATDKRRILIFVTDGEPSPASSLAAAKATLATLPDVEVFAFNIALSDTGATAQIDTTPVDGVPVVPAGDPDVLVSSIRAAFGGALPQYQGLDVLTDPAVLRQPLAETLGQTVEAIDNGFGTIVLETLLTHVQRRSTITLIDRGPARLTRRRWLLSLRGRQRAFWLPTWGRELVLQAAITSDATSIVVAPLADPSVWIGRHLMIDHPTGPIFREITAATWDALGIGLSITAPGKSIPLGTPIHLLVKVRSDADRIELKHGPNRTELALPLIETPS